MDKSKLKQKFEQIYSNKIYPQLSELESERVVIKQKVINSAIVLLVIAAIVYFLLPFEQKIRLGVLGIVAFIGIVYIQAGFVVPFIKKLKSRLLASILSIFGNFQLTDKELISFNEIKKYQFYPKSEQMNTDDKIFGRYQELDIFIQECNLTHTEGARNSENRRTVKDFSGLFVKVTMQKRFKGLTIIRPDIAGGFAKNKLQRVNLEDPEFEKMFNVFSDDRIEARYLLTTAFMERLKNIRDIFAKKENGKVIFAPEINCAFDEGYIIIAIESFEDFFEVGSIWSTLINKDNFEKVFYQMISIFDLIYTLKLNQNIGM